MFFILIIVSSSPHLEVRLSPPVRVHMYAWYHELGSYRIILSSPFQVRPENGF